MKIIRDLQEMQAYALQARAEGKSAGLVPTMGYLHEGHLSLVQLSRRDDDLTFVSIFVNPIQFVPGEDLEAYPRDEARDCMLLEKEGVDAVFIPKPEDVYPKGHCTRISLEGPALGWCGDARPGHFTGVATICTMLFNLCQPHRAYFGQKDAQQVAVIKRLVDDLHLPLEIIVGSIVREADGLAMSSRNVYLQDNERKAALVLSRGLWAAERDFEAGETQSMRLLKTARDLWAQETLVEGEYAGIVNSATMKSVERAQPGDLILVAARVGRARLIDNWRLGDQPPDL